MYKEMSISEALGEPTPWVPSSNKWSRSKFRRKSRQNPKKKTSLDYVKSKRGMGHLSRSSDDKWIPTNSGYTRGQCWNFLNHAWIGFKRALNPKNGETFQDQLKWARIIQDVQTALGLQRSSFPQLGLLGNVIFTYDINKQSDLEDLDYEEKEKAKAWKKERRIYSRGYR